MRKQRTLERKLGINPQVAQRLITAKIDTVKRARLADEDALSAIEGVSKKDAKDWKKLQPRRK